MRENAIWTNASTGKQYSCNYRNCTTDNYILKGTYLYHTGSRVYLSDDDVETGLMRKWVYYSTCQERIEQFNTAVQTFYLSQNLPATYSGRRGGEDFAEDFFAGDQRRIAYFSDKECEVVIRSTFLNQYLKPYGGVGASIWNALTCCFQCCRKRS